MNAPTFRLEWANGDASRTADTVRELAEIVRRAYPDASIGHDGDLMDGGHRTLVWADEESAANDSGARSIAAIYRTDGAS